MNQVVLFDLDGTLLDSLDDIALCGNTALGISGLPAHTREEYSSYIGNGAAMLVRRMMTPEEYECHGQKVWADYMAIYGDLCATGCKTFPGVLAMLERLQKAGLRTAVLSNKPDCQTRAVGISTFGRRLDLAQGQREGVAQKPDPAGVRDILERLEGEGVAYVGDSDVDMRTGKNAGLYTIGVTWGTRSRSLLLETGADAIADTMEELEGLILAAGLRERETAKSEA